MSSQTQTIHSSSIYHALPTFPPSSAPLSAIVAGANGISGDHMIRVLMQSPQRWGTIYALSRRPPAKSYGEGIGKEGGATVKYLSMDFLNSGPEELARGLREAGVKANYVFFFSYIQPPPKEGQGLWSDSEKMVKMNATLLSNFLSSLPLASIHPNRILLQTGAKHYGIHLGPTIAPYEESDPRVQLEPNFYYAQEDLLFAHCQSTDSAWNVIMPGPILGAVKDAAMNAVFPLGVFLSVHAYLRKPLIYPGDLAAYQTLQTSSSAMMNAYLEEWAVLSPGTANQRFNACDGGVFSWSRLWPKLAGLYGVEVRPPGEDGDGNEYRRMEMPYEPPPSGLGPRGTINYTYTLTEWAKQPEVQDTWAKISKEHNLVQSPFTNDQVIERVFAFADTFVLASWPGVPSMDKCRKLGWHGFVNTFESFHAVLKEFEDMKMLPPLPK